MNRLSNAIGWLYHEFGVASVYRTGPDAWLIILARTCRMFAFGAISLIIALFLSSMKYSDFRIGLFMTLTLVGDVILSLSLALVADRVGRRRVLAIGGGLMILSGAVFVYFENYFILVAAAIVGVISASGGDFGPFRSIEESTISHLTTTSTRSDVLSWYVTTSTLGSAIGTETAGHMVDVLKRLSGGSITGAYHMMFWTYVIMGGMTVTLASMMSKNCEAPEQYSSVDSGNNEDAASLLRESLDNESDPEQGHGGHTPDSAQSARNDSSAAAVPTSQSWFRRKWTQSNLAQISSESLPVVSKLWILLTIDSLADGMVSYSLTNYYLARKFALSESYLGNIMSISYLLMAISTIFAGPLARRLGLVNTMVFTHLPSSAAVLLFPLPQSVGFAIALLFIRTGLNNMDQAPRAAFIAAVVKPSERTAVMGITSMLRTLGSTIGPSLTGWLAQTDRFWIAYVIAGALRIGYDLGLFFLFVGMRIETDDRTEQADVGSDDEDYLGDGDGVPLADRGQGKNAAASLNNH